LLAQRDLLRGERIVLRHVRGLPLETERQRDGDIRGGGGRAAKKDENQNREISRHEASP
jgi:hypothetical protein